MMTDYVRGDHFIAIDRFERMARFAARNGSAWVTKRQLGCDPEPKPRDEDYRRWNYS